MKTFLISLSTLEDILKFIDRISVIDYECNLSSRDYTVDAKSLLGILSLDIHQQLKLQIYSNESELDYVEEIIGEFLVK